jgi:hypothetical protein
MGINSENFSGFLGGPNDAYVYAAGNEFHIGNITPNKHLGFFVGGGNVDEGNKFALYPNNQHQMTGSLDVSGSVKAFSFTGSLLGTASFANNATSASYAFNATSASYAITASYASNVPDTASHAITASYAVSASHALTASYAQTASFVQNAQTASYVQNAQTASYVQNAQTASYVLNAVSASFATVAASGTGSFTGSFVGNLTGTASRADNATSASYAFNATTASYVLNAVSASFASSGTGNFTGSFSGSFFGNGGGLTNISASSVVGLNLSQIASGSVTASVDPNGFKVNSNATISGSTQITGSLGVTGSVSITGSGTVLSANVDTIVFTGSFAQSGSVNINGNITSTGTITAQTLVVQTITSSVDFVTGSTRFGSLLSNTHQFTGSVGITGSLSLNVTNIQAVGGFQQTFSAATTWTATHNLNTLYPVITVYNGSGQVIIPTSITATDVNTTTVTFNVPVAGTINIISGQLQQNVPVQNPTAVALSIVLGG